jgi:EmrB/QacA subfamily drug resistance transporter
MVEQQQMQDRQFGSQYASHSQLVLGLIIIAAFLDVIDFSIVNVALPTIRTDLLVSLAESQWVIGAYGLTMAGFLMLSGRAGDVYGQKRLFIAGIILFTVASLTSGLAPTFLLLIVSRGIQGIGAAMTSATALSILTITFPEGVQRNRAMGIFIAFLSAGFAAGAIAGGALTSAFGWRSVMFVNVPIGIAAAVLSRRFLPENGGESKVKHLDLPGAISVTSGLLFLVYGLTQAATYGLQSLQTTLPLALSAVMLVCFVGFESRSKDPLMPLSFLRRGTVLVANVLSVVVTAGAAGFLFILTIYLQQVLGYSALNAGLAFLPLTIIFFLGAGWGSTWLVNHFGMKYTLIFTMALITVGSAMLTQISVAAGYIGILPGMTLWVLGASLSFTALNLAGLAGTRPGEEGLASGLLNTSQRVGGPLGLAVLLTIASATDPSPNVFSGLASSLTGAVIGFQYAFLASAILNSLGLVIALTIKREKNNPIPNSRVLA